MLALVAGTGRLPGLLAERLDAEGRAYVVASIEGHGMEDPGPREILWFRIETLGSLLQALASRGCTEVCFAGAIARPPLDPARVDAATMPLVPRMMAALGQGDDGALRVALTLFEEAGMQVRAAHELLPDLMPAPGVLAGAGEDAAAVAREAARGAEVIAALAAADLGQACVIARGQAVALEAQPGTAWMLRALADVPGAQAAGGVLYKAPKPGQDMRVDVPTIGADTVEQAAAAGLAGIVLAPGVQVLDREAVLAAARRLGLFIHVQAPG